MFAAVGSDGTRDVVWGKGETYEAALEDAAKWLADQPHVDLTVHEITAAMAAEIAEGCVDWAELTTSALERAHEELRDRYLSAVSRDGDKVSLWVDDTPDSEDEIDRPEPTRSAQKEFAQINSIAAKHGCSAKWTGNSVPYGDRTASYVDVTFGGGR